jgi:DnaJ-class molecular chaperone
MKQEKYFNSFCNKYIIINDGEELCFKCKGKGTVKITNIFNRQSIILKCDKCLGDGKIDWVDKATGKNRAHGA